MTETLRTCSAKQEAPAVHCEPPISQWDELVRTRPSGEMLGRSQEQWRQLTRRELGLPVDRPVIGTGHQAYFWHPGILAKYIALDAFALSRGFAPVNVIVDQDLSEFGEVEVPVLNAAGSLEVARVRIAEIKRDIPTARHSAVLPIEPPGDTVYAIESVAAGVRRMAAALQSHSGAPSAAAQVAAALDELMQRWARPATNIPASVLCETTLARMLMQRMAEQPPRCAEAYNRAVAAVPEAGIEPLRVGDDVELPLWRIADDGVRVRGNAADLEQFLQVDASRPLVAALQGQFMLLPRALFMTAIVRLGLCDVFIHGTGGVIYDRAMELWIRDWLGAEVSPMAAVTADVRLPLLENDAAVNVAQEKHHARHVWHDPARDSQMSVSATKRAMLDEIATKPHGSAARRRAFFAMHGRLEAMRQEHKQHVQQAWSRVEEAAKREAEGKIASRRDWAFPLYPQALLDELAQTLRAPSVA